VHFYSHPFEWAGVDIRWFSVDEFDTRWILRSLSCGWGWVSRGSCESFGRLRPFQDALLSRPRERKRAGAQDLYTIRCVVGCSEAPTCAWAPKAHTVASKKQERHCAKSSGTNLLVLEQTHDKFFDRQLLAINNYYGVATISRMLKNIGLFCKRALQKRPVFCKETCIFKHPTHRSHPIATISNQHDKFTSLLILLQVHENELERISLQNTF